MIKYLFILRFKPNLIEEYYLNSNKNDKSNYLDDLVNIQNEIDFENINYGNETINGTFSDDSADEEISLNTDEELYLNKDELNGKTKILKSRKLYKDINIRWNSIFMMIKSVLVHKECVMQIISKLFEKDLFFSKEEWQELEDYVNFLNYFFQSSNQLAHKDKPTINLIIFRYAILKDKIINTTLFNSEDKLKIIEKFESRFKIKEIYILASILDPSRKDLYEVENYLNKNKITKEELIIKYLKLYNINYNKKSLKGKKINESDDEDDLELIIKYSNLSTKINDNENDSLNEYLNLNPTKLEIKKNLLDWWSDNKLKYPELYELSKNILIIPASQIRSESTFSKSGLVVTPLRSEMSSSNISKVMFIDYNYELSIDENLNKLIKDKKSKYNNEYNNNDDEIKLQCDKKIELERSIKKLKIEHTQEIYKKAKENNLNNKSKLSKKNVDKNNESSEIEFSNSDQEDYEKENNLIKSKELNIANDSGYGKIKHHLIYYVSNF